MSEGSRRRPQRATLWRLLGEPADQEGSANDPVEREEQGLRWNEKWIYRAEASGRGGRPRRVVLWNRADFVGAFQVGDDGELAAEETPAEWLDAEDGECME
jgi:hypothetical protein